MLILTLVTILTIFTCMIAAFYESTSLDQRKMSIAAAIVGFTSIAIVIEAVLIIVKFLF